jgi:hypothetical protein
MIVYRVDACNGEAGAKVVKRKREDVNGGSVMLTARNQARSHDNVNDDSPP